jgi:hypothetical protein
VLLQGQDHVALDGTFDSGGGGISVLSGTAVPLLLHPIHLSTNSHLCSLFFFKDALSKGELNNG